MAKIHELTRREFLRQSAAAAGGIALLGGSVLSAQEAVKTASPNETIRIATIGCGGMGSAHIAHHEGL
jgi:hypothetical protein